MCFLTVYLVSQERLGCPGSNLRYITARTVGVGYVLSMNDPLVGVHSVGRFSNDKFA